MTWSRLKMSNNWRRRTTVFMLFTALILSGCSEKETPTPTSTSTPSSATLPASIPVTPTILAEPEISPRDRISVDRIFGYIEDLAAIQAYSGWRSSGTEGEAEAFAYASEVLGGFGFLNSLGLEIESQSYGVYLTTEIWDSRLYLTVNGQESEALADAVIGHREIIQQAMRFDSDGKLNDSDPNPQNVQGGTLLIRSLDDILDLGPDEARDKIVFLWYGAIDPVTEGEGIGAQLVSELVYQGAAAIVIVTERDHGKYAGDGTVLEESSQTTAIPILYTRLEDLSSLEIASWEGLEQVETARLIWDTDVFSPGQSGNLVARIPGQDPTRAMVLGAHIDSANTPGAADNALNAAVLFELANVLDEGAIQPPVDIYLVWFGSEELAYLGSQHFVNTHEEVLDRTIAAFLMDGFTAFEPGPTIIGMQESSHVRFGDAQLPFSEYLELKAEEHQIPIELVVDSAVFASDDGSFHGFVPHVRFAFGSQTIGETFHGPYDTLDIIQDQGEVMEQSVAMALVAALETAFDVDTLQVTPTADRRAVIVATHSEPQHMSPALLINFTRAFAWEGIDVDIVPYGQQLTPEDIAEADLVLALPVVDYSTTEGDIDLYDKSWTDEEIDHLVDYVEHGGLLVLANSANRLFFGQPADANEDWQEVNTLALRFGVSYEASPFSVPAALLTDDHPLTENLISWRMVGDNGLPFNMQSGTILAQQGGQTALGLVDYGNGGGQVLVLSDIGSLDLYNRRQNERDNLVFIRNLARYARDR